MNTNNLFDPGRENPSRIPRYRIHCTLSGFFFSAGESVSCAAMRKKGTP
jgi:hypothetical protein